MFLLGESGRNSAAGECNAPRSTRKQPGFTLIQLVVAVVIVGVLASLSFVRLSLYLKQRTLRGEVQALQGLARESRALSIKKNRPVGMAFDATHGTLSIFEDLDGNGVWQSGEPTRTLPLGEDIALGPPPDKKYQAGPAGTQVPATGLSGAWAKSLVFANDPMATPNLGALFFHHRRLDTWMACLQRSAGTQQIQAYLWDGTDWRLL